MSIRSTRWLIKKNVYYIEHISTSIIGVSFLNIRGKNLFKTTIMDGGRWHCAVIT